MKAVVIEDEEIIAQVLIKKIKRVANDIDVVAHLSSLRSARKWFAENAEPDLLFMDIQLSDGISFDLLNDFALKCPIIFTTAYDEYAVRAFKVNGIDYLLKPINDQELENAIQKCRTKKNAAFNIPTDLNLLIQQITNTKPLTQFKEKFIVNIRNQWVPINTKEIACFSKENLIVVYLHSGERYLVDYSTLDEVEELLDPKQFYRANRQFIIHIEAIQSVKPIEHSKLIIRLKDPNAKLEIDMSRLKSPEFRKWLDR